MGCRYEKDKSFTRGPVHEPEIVHPTLNFKITNAPTLI